MNDRNKRFGPKILIALVAAAGFALPLAGRASDEPQPPGDFARGAKAWAENCARCHNMREPKELNDDQWKLAVTHMRVRAGLTGQDARDIMTFLQKSN